MTPLEVLQYVAWAIAGFGVLVIALASVVAFARLVRAFLGRRIDTPHRRLDIIQNRETFTSRIIFGLDFLIASDIIISALVPTIEELTRLAGTVLIRTVLTYIISKETQELERREMWEREHGHEELTSRPPGKDLSS